MLTCIAYQRNDLSRLTTYWKKRISTTKQKEKEVSKLILANRFQNRFHSRAPLLIVLSLNVFTTSALARKVVADYYFSFLAVFMKIQHLLLCKHALPV
mmetsp:Transcript_17833/g.33562  ORF Transcript_17833/g.33562 Transcript_17833/m.33562 type:complete len:98 (-) Transcript_17833:21-314(-)